MRHFALPLLALLIFSPSLKAQERLLLSGAEFADDAYYTYLGAVLPGPGRKDGRGLLHRYWVDRFAYEYDAGPRRIRANARGAEIGLGYGASSANGWGNVWLGARYTDTSLSPDDPGATARGGQFGAKVQLEGERAIAASWRAGAGVSWSPEQNDYWSRVRLTHTRSWGAIGFDVVRRGNDESESTSVGAVVSFQPQGRNWSAAIKAGARRESNDVDSPYAGFELGYAF